MANLVAIYGPDAEYNSQDLRQRIGVMCGYNYHGDGRLPKKVLNSAYAYLTGDFLYPPMVEHNSNAREYVPKQAALQAVGREAGFIEDPSDWETSRGNFPQQYRFAELEALTEALVETDDQRNWTP